MAAFLDNRQSYTASTQGGSYKIKTVKAAHE